METDPVARPRWRVRAAAACFLVLVGAQAGFALNGYRDPHKFFAFQPFNESSTWRADIVRVTWDGARVPVDDHWGDYQWNALVDMSALRNPGQLRHAYMGVETRYLEATVTYHRNAGRAEHVVLRSEDRKA
jgi:hypothetical protein